MKKTRIFFDTNVLVYAHDNLAINHLDSVQLLQLVIDEKIQGVIAEQNIIELYRILTNVSAIKGTPLTPLQVNNLIQSVYLNGTFEIIYPSNLTINKILQLAVRNNVKSARIFDIRLAALILETNIDYFATYNTSHFQGIENLEPLTAKEILNILTI